MNRVSTLLFLAVWAVLLLLVPSNSANAQSFTGSASIQSSFSTYATRYNTYRNSHSDPSGFFGWLDVEGVSWSTLLSQYDTWSGGTAGSHLSESRCFEGSYLYYQYSTGELFTFDLTHGTISLDVTFLNSFSGNLPSSLALTVGDSTSQVFYVNSTSFIVNSLGITHTAITGAMPGGMSVVETAPGLFCLQGAPTVKGDYTVSIKGMTWSSSLSSPAYNILLAVRDNRGTLSVSARSTSATAPNAKWRRVGTSTWFSNNALETGIRIGTYTVEFQLVYGFETPPSQQVIIQDDQTTTITPTYTALPTAVQVNSPGPSSVGLVTTSSTSATVSDLVTSHSFDTQVWFDYGTSTAYGGRIAAAPVLANGTTNVSSVIAGLSPGTLYHVRCTAYNVMGPFVSPDFTFTTPALPSFSSALAASASFEGASATMESGAAETSAPALHEMVTIDPSTRNTTILYLDRGIVTGTAHGPVIPRNLELRALADFNSDGEPDWVLVDGSSHRVTIWSMCQGTRTGTKSGPVLPSKYDVAGAADFAGDGKPDLLLFNPATDKTEVLLLDGSSSTTDSLKPGPMIPKGFKVVSVVDLQENGKPGLLLWNPASHKSKIVVLNGCIPLATVTMLNGPSTPSGWSLVGAEAVDSGAPATWILFNQASHATARWSVKMGKVSSSQRGPSLSWHLTPMILQ